MAKRKYLPVGESYITEWLGITYPPGTWRTNVALGDVKTPETLRLTPAEERFVKKPLRPIADAVVILPSEVHLIEAKIRNDRGKIEQLLLYRYLFPRTPEFQQYRDRKIRTILVTPREQGSFIEFLKRYDIEVVIYNPPWVQEYLGSIERKSRRGTYYSVKF